MSFQKSAESLRAKAHMTDVPKTTIAGAVVLLIACACAACATFFSCTPESSFEVVTEAKADAGDEGPEVDGEPSDDESGPPSSGEADEAFERESVQLIQVHVAGAVEAPGVYVLEDGARVNDAVIQAQGLTDDACAEAVNLARPLMDGEQVYVPTIEEIETGNDATASSAAGGAVAASSPADDAGLVLVNINTANAAQLEQLPGVGPATAAAIIDERESNGLFAAPEDLMRVTGIGEKKYAKLKDLICV